MSQYKSQVQNQFLSAARKKHLKVEVILETGTVLRGKIQAYDQFSISLSFKDKVEVIYKSSIIYIAIMQQHFSRRPTGGRGYRPSSDRKPRDQRPPRPSYPDFDEDINDPPPPKKPPKMKII
jgi:RNA chaperone Hfq